MAGEEADQLAKQLRELLVKTRKAKGLTQVQLAKALGRTQTFVSNYERGERRVAVVDFILIAAALREEASALLRKII